MEWRRNYLEMIAKKFYYIWRRIDCLINVSLSNKDHNSHYQASKELVLPLPYKQPIALPPGSIPA